MPWKEQGQAPAPVALVLRSLLAVPGVLRRGAGFISFFDCRGRDRHKAREPSSPSPALTEQALDKCRWEKRADRLGSRGGNMTQAGQGAWTLGPYLPLCAAWLWAGHLPAPGLTSSSCKMSERQPGRFLRIPEAREVVAAPECFKNGDN